MEPIIRTIQEPNERQVKDKPYGDVLNNTPSTQEVNPAYPDDCQIQIKGIWQNILGVVVSTESNFFEIGGHSLAAVKVIQNIYDDLRIDLNVSDLYERPTLSAFANYVKEMNIIKEVNRPLPALEKNSGHESFPVTSAQRRLWFVDKYENSALAYNVPLVFNIEGDLHISRLKKAFTTLVNRHDIFQTSFVMDEKNCPRQVITPTISFELKTEEVKADITSRIREIIQLPFDLENAPLFRAILLKFRDQSDRYTLVMVVHHILGDEITINFLLTEINKLYQEDYDDNSKCSSIIDYAVWEKEFIQTRLNDCEKYWDMVIASWQLENPVWKLRLKENMEVSGKNTIIEIDDLLFVKIKSFASLQGVSLHSVFVSMLSAFIYRYFNKEKVAFLVPISCREHKEAARMPGFFLNLLPLMQKINDNLLFVDHAKQTNKQISELLSHRFFPFEEIKSKLSYNGELQIDAIVSFQDRRSQQLSLEGLNISQRHVHTEFVKFPLNFIFYIYDLHGEIEIEFSDSIDLFNFPEVNKSFLNFIMSIRHDLQRSIFQVLKSNRDGSYATQDERKHILFKFAEDLVSLGFGLRNINGLKEKHILAVVTHWVSEKLSNATLKNRMSALRYLAGRINKPNIVPKNDRLAIGKRSYVPQTNRAIFYPDFSKVTDKFIRISLELQRVFGLRREESLKIRPYLAEKGDHIVLQPSWCKGGRGRIVPVRTDEQRYWLDQAKELVKLENSSLIPFKKSYVQQRALYDKQVNRAGLKNLHGLRHAYAQRRYKELTGWEAPINGGLKSRELTAEQKQIDYQARMVLTEELAHSREQITVNYLGR